MTQQAKIVPHALVILIALITFGDVRPTVAGDSASVLMYHRFGDSRYPTTNVTLEQLDAHIEELVSGKYTVLPIPEIISRQKHGEGLPDRTVGISIDDAYTSTYTEAWPRLRDAGIPFTLFISSGPIDEGHGDTMTWDNVREMARAGVTIGAHTVSHLHMPAHDAERMKQEIESSGKRYMEELGKMPTIFAYPYGEANLEAISLVKQAGYEAAFGQHSGAFDSQDDRYFLPRFPLNEKYGDMGRFRTAANALALSVTDITPKDMTVSASPAAPAMGFTLRKPLPRLDELSCFLSHEGKADLVRLGESRFEIRVGTPFPPGRTRLNCTLPGAGEHAGRWYWFGQQYYLPKN